MLTQKRIEEELRPIDGLDWITALRAPQIQKLVSDGVLQLSLFDDRDLAEITHPDYPGERLVVCRNPLLAEERKRKREELIKSAEKKLATIITATRRKKQPLKDISKINFRIGKELGPLKVAKYFQWEMHPEGLVVKRDEKRIQADAILDGVYVLRTSVAADRINTDETVLAYKRLAGVERAFRSTKNVDLHVRPIHHRSADRVRAHVFLCMLAYYVEWHMRRKLTPVLFDDEHSGQRQGLGCDCGTAFSVGNHQGASQTDSGRFPSSELSGLAERLGYYRPQSNPADAGVHSCIHYRDAPHPGSALRSGPTRRLPLNCVL